MNVRSFLEPLILDAIRHHGGKASVLSISKYILDNHEADIRKIPNAIYTWQYDMRWTGQNLQKAGKLVKYRNGWEIR